MARGKLIPWLLVLAAIVPLAGLAWAPYLPRLMWEGYPGETWPAPGAHVVVAGGDGTDLRTDTRASAFDPVGRRLFDDRQGRALLISHDSRLVFEHYAAGIDRATRLNSYSLVKSLVGVLVLKAHAEGRIASLDDTIGTYLPDLGDATVRAVPIVRFLRMASGIAFETDRKKAVGGEASKDIERARLNPFGPMARLHMLGLDAVAPGLTVERPGESQFNYQNINTAILGRLLTVLHDRPLAQILSAKIWRPAGADTAQWRAYGPWAKR